MSYTGAPLSQQYPQHPAPRPTSDPVGEVVKRVSRIEAAAWIGMGFSIATFGVVIYWSIKVFQMIHALQDAFEGVQ